MLVNPSSYAAFVFFICGIQVVSFTEGSMKLKKNLEIEKYVFIIKEMNISKVLQKFRGTLNLTVKRSLTVHTKLEIAQLQTSL